MQDDWSNSISGLRTHVHGYLPNVGFPAFFLGLNSPVAAGLGRRPSLNQVEHLKISEDVFKFAFDLVNEAELIVEEDVTGSRQHHAGVVQSPSIFLFARKIHTRHYLLDLKSLVLVGV